MPIENKSGIPIRKTLRVDGNGEDYNDSATKATAVTPSDATVLAATKGLYLGAAGDVAVTMADGNDATFTALTNGMVHPISVTKVKATGTTATGILAIY